MYQRSPRDQFVFGSAMSSGRVTKPIDSDMPRKVLQTTTLNALEKTSNKSFEFSCVTTISDRNNTAEQLATEIFCQPHQQVSNKSDDLHDKLPFWKAETIQCRSASPRPGFWVVRQFIKFIAFSNDTFLSYIYSLAGDDAHTPRVTYLGTAAGVESVKSAARIKKYNLICVLLPHWMAAGCSPIKMEIKLFYIKEESSYETLINSNFISLQTMSWRTLFALFKLDSINVFVFIPR